MLKKDVSCLHVSILDYGSGNIGSIINMLDFINVPYDVITHPYEVESCDLLILPGVGHFKSGMLNLKNRNLIEPLNCYMKSLKPILGICLGMQLMTLSSEEGGEGLGWFDCQTKRFPFLNHDSNPLIVPHMGWNYITHSSNQSIIKSTDRYYFVHSYYVDCADSSFCLSTSTYGGVNFASAIQKGRMTGVQFHPEKSHQYGISFFKQYFESEGFI